MNNLDADTAFLSFTWETLIKSQGGPWTWIWQIKQAAALIHERGHRTHKSRGNQARSRPIRGVNRSATTTTTVKTTKTPIEATVRTRSVLVTIKNDNFVRIAAAAH